MGKIFKALEKSQAGDMGIDVPDTNRPDTPADTRGEAEAGRGITQDAERAAGSSDSFSLPETKPQSQPRRGEQEIPEYGKLDPSLITEFKPYSVEAEQFRLLKTNILFPDRGEPARSIMVTSTVPGEGKSFVATNLAISIAKSIDEYVLLIDADLRRPSVHSRFGFPDDTPGLSEHLSKGVAIPALLRKTAIDKLTILPCGEPPANPAELVSSDQMRQLIREVKSRYEDRYIIIDSPPPYLTSEANALARQVDGIVIVIKYGSTKKEALQDIIDTYGRDKILGVVKNFSPLKKNFRYKQTYVYH